MLDSRLYAASTLCNDPLCDHKGNDNPCLDNNMLLMFDINSDGKYLYASVLNTSQPTDESGSIIGYIYKVDIENMSASILTKYRRSGSSSDNIECDGEYVYYYEGFYKEGTDRSAVGKDDQYVRFMRVKTSGGEPEAAIGRDMNVSDRIYVGVDSYYVLSLSEQSDNTDGMLVIDKKSGKESYVSVPDIVSICGVVAFGGNTYLACVDKVQTFIYENTTNISTYSIYRCENDGSFTLLAANLAGFAFYYDKLWCEVSAIEYVGSRELPTGKGSETELQDIFNRSDGSFYSVDLASGEKTGEWKLDNKLTIIGESNGMLIAQLSDVDHSCLETGVNRLQYVKLSLNADGTVTKEGVLLEYEN